MRHHELAALAVRAGGGANGEAEIEQLQRVEGEESGELHVGRLSDVATPLLWDCNELSVSIRPVYQCSTAPMRVEKPLFKAGLNSGIRGVEHFSRISGVFREDVHCLNSI